MTYKDSISSFRTQLEDIAFTRNVPVKKYNDLEIIFKLSSIQSEISNLYGLYEVKTTFSSTGLQEYTLETVLPDCLNVIKLSVNGINLDKVPMDVMNEVTASSGDPTVYSIFNGKLTFDTLYTGTVTAYYYKRLNPYDSSDTDFDVTKTGWQTTGWLIAEEYHPYLIEGALAKIFPDMLTLYWQRLTNLIKRKRIMPIKAEGFLGI